MKTTVLLLAAAAALSGCAVVTASPPAETDPIYTVSAPAPEDILRTASTSVDTSLRAKDYPALWDRLSPRCQEHYEGDPSRYVQLLSDRYQGLIIYPRTVGVRVDGSSGLSKIADETSAGYEVTRTWSPSGLVWKFEDCPMPPDPASGAAEVSAGVEAPAPAPEAAN